ncbi:MAG: preprotein translocase subunit YajC [Verrucomicrobia bacterium]|nr:MAG: preprotein translocase subunit YajC [Verrucomicrobiota bacterium]
MSLNLSQTLLADAAPAGQAPPGWVQLVPIALLGVIMIVMFRSQSKKARDHETMLKTLRSGDKVITSGGIIATVVTVKDTTAMVRSADSKFEISKSAITQITERGGDSSES